MFTALLVACLFLLSACKSTETPLTPEQEMAAKNIEASGGLEAITAIQSIKMSGGVAVMGMDLELTIYQKRPGKVRSEVNIPSMGMQIINAYDGETAWSINPMAGSGAQKVTGDQARGIIEQADMDGIFVGYEEKGISLEYLGEEEVRGKNTHKMRAVRADGTENVVYLDADTFLIAKTEGEGIDPTSGSKTSVETYTSDYRAVAGVQMPHALEIIMAGTNQDVTITAIEANLEVDDAIFVMPGN